MADSASQAHASPSQEHVKVASQSLQPSERLPSVAAALSMAANSTGEPLALATVSGNVGTTTGMSPTRQRVVVSKPVFKMKRTGQSTLPRAIPTPGRWSNIPTPTSPHGLYAEPEPAQIVSDILPPQPPSTPTPDAMAAQPKPNSASDSTRKTKYATDEERRKATSLALKRTFTVSLYPC